MRRQYYILNTRGFSNTYDLAYADTVQEEAQAREEGWDRITRREAEHLCSLERARQKDDPAFSGFASTVILPISYPVNDRDWRNDSRVYLDGYIVERVNR